MLSKRKQVREKAERLDKSLGAKRSEDGVID